MKRCSKIFRIAHIVFLLLSVILLIVSFKLDTIPANTEYSYERGEIISHSWHDTFCSATAIFAVLVIAAAVTYTIISAIHKSDTKMRTSAIWIMTVISVIMIILSQFIVVPHSLADENDYSPEYFEFTNGSNRIVIEEKSYLLYGGGNVYQITTGNKAEIIGRFNTDDGFRNKGVYDIEWFSDHAEIAYKYHSGDELTKKLIVNFT